MSSLDVYSGRDLQIAIAIMSGGYTVADLEARLSEVSAQCLSRAPKKIIECRHTNMRGYSVNGLNVSSCRCGYSEVVG